MSKIVIDGLFLTEQINGVQRYGLEIVKQLDMINPDLDIEIAVPADSEIKTVFEHFPIVPVGKRKGKIWEQTDLPRYLRKTKAFPVFFENVLPLSYRKGIIAVHDISLRVNPSFFNRNLRGRLSIAWRRINYHAALKSKTEIITVSEFAKKEICRYYKVDPARITVIYNAWQHIKDVAEDESVFDRYPGIVRGDYYFALSTLAKNKNFPWIVNAAKQNLDKTFVIAGGGNLKAFLEENEASDLKNLYLLGYISDEQAKALMANCRSFLFPTFYEGFGIPPLEAIASGAGSIVVSDIEVMHEVYGKVANYIDPHSEEPELKGINEITSEDREDILNRFSWRKSAQILFELLMKHK